MADFNETDTNIAIGKIMKLIEELKDAKGNGDSLLSIIVPPRDDDLSRVTQELVNKVFPACHESAIRAITSAQQKLQLYSKVPPNGLVIYTGTVVTDDGSTKEVSIDFEPFEPMHTSSLCLLDNKFSMEGLSELLEYEENYVRENDKNVAIWKVKQLMKALQYAQGHGDSLISIFMEPGKEISQFTEMLDDRFGTASTSSINMSAIGAITSAQQILKRYSKVPPNGLIVYTGTVVTDGKEEKDIKVGFEPFKPIDGSICQLHHRFHIETLYVMLKQPEYGFIVMADNKALFGILSGNTKKVLLQFTVNCPSWRQIGGADHEYFRRQSFRETYLGWVVDWAKTFYIDYSDVDFSAIVVAVSPTYQTDFIDMLDPRLRKKIMCMVEVSYAGNHGFDTAIDLSSNHLYNVRFIQEIWLLKKFMKEMNQETKKYVTGVEDTLKCLDLGAVKILIVWENLDINRYVLKNTTTSELITMHLNKEQETNQSNFRETATNAELEVQEKKSLLEWFAEEYKEFGCTLEFVTDSSREGSQFCRAFGGIGGILKYQVDIQAFDNLSDAGDQPDIQSSDDHSDDGDQLDIGSFYLSDDGED